MVATSGKVTVINNDKSIKCQFLINIRYRTSTSIGLLVCVITTVPHRLRMIESVYLELIFDLYP